MAKVYLTRKTFTNYLSQNLEKENLGLEGMFMKAFTGKNPEELIADVPDEQKLWVDTDHIVAVSQLTKMQETGDVVFRLYFDTNEKDLQNMWFKGEEYEDFMHIWAGTRKYLDEGVYKVGLGIKSNPGETEVQPEMWAELSEDKLTVTVHRAKPV